MTALHLFFSRTGLVSGSSLRYISESIEEALRDCPLEPNRKAKRQAEYEAAKAFLNTLDK
jgi:hypothetical protein